MSFLKKALASVGIGNADVDLIFETDRLVQGQTVNGIVKVKGGSVSQVVEKVYLNLVVDSYVKDGDDAKSYNNVVSAYDLAKGFEINKGEYKEFPFSIDIPINLPISINNTKLYFVAGLDIENALDPKDKEPVLVYPTPAVQSVLNALADDLGFRHQYVSGFYNGRFQWLEMTPTHFMKNALDEIEFMINEDADNIYVFMEFDRKAKGLLGKLMDEYDLDEHRTRLTIPKSEILVNGNYNISKASQIMRSFIEKESRG